MLDLKDFLAPLENFQYSVNLEFDINDEKKIASFIPTGSALEIIEEIILSTKANSTDRTRLLTGAYGKGKSHLTLSLLGILARKDKALFSQILSKAAEINPRIAGNINQYLENGTRLLPVILNSQSIDLRSTVLSGLSKALKTAELNGVMPTTFFDAAIDKIKNWEAKYPETYIAFREKVGSIDDFINKLKAFNNGEYKYFVEIYPTLTSGSEFNPMNGADVISILESVVSAIKKKGYNGLFLVYDEFSKFLDGNAEAGSAQNVKLLQDIAEKFNRSGENQLHLLLISHKNIENYVGDLPKKIVDDWKGISKRFKPLTIESSDAEIFEMIAEVLKKEPTNFLAFQKKYAESFKRLRELFDSSKSGNVGKRSAFTEVIKHTGIDFVEKCFPMHPYSLLLLPKISELVAQNERTIFTFLASEEKHSVIRFMRSAKAGFNIIEPDQIYDFFEQEFKNESFGSAIRRHWQIAASAIGKIATEENPLAVKLIKSITLLYIINQFDILPPSLDLVREMYSVHSDSEFYRAANTIIENGLLIKLEFRPHVRIREISGNNADELILKEITRLENNFNVREALSKSLSVQYLYPVAYNDTFEMTRYFKIEFVDKTILQGIENITEYISDGKSDGYVFAVIANDEEDRTDAIAEIQRLQSNRVVFVVPKVPLDISRSIIKYTAIKNELEKDKKEKKLTASTIDELTYILDDISELIANYTDSYFFSPEQKKAEYYYMGELRCIYRKTGLSALLSEICDVVFNHTPVIVNENINREVISAPMKATRNRILKGLLSPIIPANFGLSGSQDINVVRSVLLVPGIITSLAEPRLSFNDLDANFTDMFNHINQFILRVMAEEGCFGELYDMLKNPERSISLRSGVIPFYIAAALCPYKKNTVIKRKNREMLLSAELLEDINDSPTDFSIRIENVDNDKRTYIAGIERAIPNYIDNSEREYSSFNYVVRGLQSWFLHLSRFDRETKKYCDGIDFIEIDSFMIGLKKALSAPEINAHEFLFKMLPKIAGQKTYGNSVANKLRVAVEKIENNSRNVVRKVLISTKDLLGGGEQQSLSSTMQDYYDSLSDRTKVQVFCGQEAKLMEVLRLKGEDDGKIVLTLIKNLTALRLEDMNDALVSTIESTIKEVKESVDKFNKDTREIVTSSAMGYDITFKNADGTKEVRHISKSDLPTNARTFANEIEDVFDSYGESLTTPEKVQICLEVMKKLFR